MQRALKIVSRWQRAGSACKLMHKAHCGPAAHRPVLGPLQVWRPFLRVEQGQAVGGPVTRHSKLCAALRAHMSSLPCEAQDSFLQSLTAKLEAAWNVKLSAEHSGPVTELQPQAE